MHWAVNREHVKRVNPHQKRRLLLLLRIVTVVVAVGALIVFWSNQPLLSTILTGTLLAHVLGLYLIERTYI